MRIATICDEFFAVGSAVSLQTALRLLDPGIQTRGLVMDLGMRPSSALKLRSTVESLGRHSLTTIRSENAPAYRKLADH
jgi:hypothetical protein